jgi:hypothetical protein
LKKRTKKLFPGASHEAAPLSQDFSAAGIRPADFIRPTPTMRAKHPGKVFWFFFSKKNMLPSP